jgi:uncharacterized membrane protein YtjA (UPF0391 family)
MLRLALVFVLIALLAAVFGFGLVAGESFPAARIIFVIFLVLAVLCLLFGYRRVPLD